MNDDSKKGLFIGGAIAVLVIAIGLIVFFVVRSGKANQAGDKPLDATPPPNAQKMMQEMSQRASQGAGRGGGPPQGMMRGYPGMGR